MENANQQLKTLYKSIRHAAFNGHDDIVAWIFECCEKDLPKSIQGLRNQLLLVYAETGNLLKFIAVSQYLNRGSVHVTVSKFNKR